MSNGAGGTSSYRWLLYLVGFCIVSGIAMQSGVGGAVLTLVSFGIAIAIAAGRIQTAKRNAVLPAVVGAAALLGTFAGVTARREEAANAQRVRVAEAARTRAAADRAATVRVAAPELMAQTRTNLDRARGLLQGGQFDEAHAAAEASKAALAETASLVPPVQGVAPLVVEADSLFQDSANLSAIQAALHDAQEAKTTRPGSDDALAWSARLETLAATLRQAPPVAVARFGEDLSREADALDRQRARYRRQVDRAQRAENERIARIAVCGDRPPLIGGFDGELVGSESYVARAANDPDSIDVANCTPPVLTERACWVTDCDVRGRNAFGALVLSRYRFSVGRAGIFEARPVR